MSLVNWVFDDSKLSIIMKYIIYIRFDVDLEYRIIIILFGKDVLFLVKVRMKVRYVALRKFFMFRNIYLGIYK